MKRFSFVIICLFTTLLCFPQRNIRVSDGKIFNEAAKTSPIRTINTIDGGLEVTYQFTNVELLNSSFAVDEQMIQIDGFTMYDEAGCPSVLSKNDCFAIPDGLTASVSLISCDYIDIPFKLAPAIEPNVIGTKGIRKDTEIAIEPYDGFFPKTIVSKAFVQTYKKQPLLYVSVSPFQYDYQHEKVRLYRSFTYRVNYNTLPPKNMHQNIYYNANLHNRILNNDIASAVTDSTEHYLILSVSKYKDAVYRFAEWKRYMGYVTHVAMKDSGQWSVDSIKQVVKKTYQDTNSLLNYMLIIGDQEDVPGENHNEYINSDYGIADYVTDHYYACVDDSIVFPWGAVAYDFTPDIHIGRLPVSTIEEANIVVDKIINYELNPIEDPNFYKTLLHCAEYVDENGDGQEDFGYKFVGESEEIRMQVCEQDSLLDAYGVYSASPSVNPSIIGGFPLDFFYDFYDDLEGYITDYINNGVNYVLYKGHGEINEWNLPRYDYHDIARLQNQRKLPVVFSSACLTGKYNAGTCLAEHFLRKSNGGCVAIFAASDIAWSSQDYTYTKGLFDAIWPPLGTNNLIPVYRLGEMFDQAKGKIIGGTHYFLSDRPKYMLEVLHCFGDPSMMFMTSMPTSFENVSINRTDSGIEVDLPNDTARITFYDKFSGNVITTQSNHASYNGNPEEVTVCISGHNKRPYIDEGTLYIQNQNIYGDSSFGAKNIRIGSNVTSTIPSGPVSITSGTSSFIGRTIEIHGETSIEIGANVLIQNP